MIKMSLITHNTHNAQYLIEYHRRLINVKVPRRKRKYRMTEYRHAICMATKLDAIQFRHVGNHRVNGNWISYWTVMEESKSERSTTSRT